MQCCYPSGLLTMPGYRDKGVKFLALSTLYHTASSGSVFICLVVNTHLSWVKITLSFVHSFMNIVVVIVVFQEL